MLSCYFKKEYPNFVLAIKNISFPAQLRAGIVAYFRQTPFSAACGKFNLLKIKEMKKCVQ